MPKTGIERRRCTASTVCWDRRLRRELIVEREVLVPAGTPFALNEKRVQELAITKRELSYQHFSLSIAAKRLQFLIV